MEINIEEWFDVKALLSSIAAEINVVTSHKFYAFTMPNKTVYVMVSLLEELISEQFLNCYPEDDDPLQDRDTRINVLIECVDTLRRDYGVIDERFLRPGYFFGKFEVTYGTATKTRQYVPFTFDAFGLDLSVENGKPNSIARVSNIAPHYENPYYGGLVPEFTLNPTSDPVREESISWLYGHESMFIEKMVYGVNVIEGGSNVAKFGGFSMSDGTIYISPTTAFEVAQKTAETLARLNGRDEPYPVKSTDVPKIIRQVAMKYGVLRVDKLNEGVVGCYTVEWQDGGVSYRKYPFYPLDGRAIISNFDEIDEAKPERIQRVNSVELFC